MLGPLGPLSDGRDELYNICIILHKNLYEVDLHHCWLQKMEDKVAAVYQPIRKQLSTSADVNIEHLLAAREGRIYTHFTVGKISC